MAWGCLGKPLGWLALLGSGLCSMLWLTAP